MDDQRVRAVIGALAGLGALAVLSAIPGWWWVTVFALAAMIGGVGLIIVDINVQLRQHRSDFLKATARLQTPAKPETAATGADLARVVRLVQAQFVGRLDRALSALETATTTVQRLGGPAAGRDGFAGLPHGSTVLLHRLDAATLAQAKLALTHGLSVEAVVTDSADRERLDAAGIGDSVTILAGASATPYAMTVVLPDVAA